MSRNPIHLAIIDWFRSQYDIKCGIYASHSWLEIRPYDNPLTVKVTIDQRYVKILARKKFCKHAGHLHLRTPITVVAISDPDCYVKISKTVRAFLGSETRIRGFLNSDISTNHRLYNKLAEDKV